MLEAVGEEKTFWAQVILLLHKQQDKQECRMEDKVLLIKFCVTQCEMKLHSCGISKTRAVDNFDDPSSPAPTPFIH